MPVMLIQLAPLFAILLAIGDRSGRFFMKRDIDCLGFIKRRKKLGMVSIGYTSIFMPVQTLSVISGQLAKIAPSSCGATTSSCA